MKVYFADVFGGQTEVVPSTTGCIASSGDDESPFKITSARCGSGAVTTGNAPQGRREEGEGGTGGRTEATGLRDWEGEGKRKEACC